MTQSLCGILNVDKPWGWTSHDVVGLVRRLTGLRQVGHAGTLDPRATGVLLVTLGAATRLSDYLMRGRKCYLARLRLGLRTTTDDGEGEVVATAPIDAITRDHLVSVLARYRGVIRQVPPQFAAIKQEGVPAYRQARRGVQVEMAPREVRIDGMALLDMADGAVDLLVWCSAGTYIRALARDVGEALGCGAHLAALRRLSSGAFGVDAATGVEALRWLAAEGRLSDCLWAADEAVATLQALVVDDAAAAAVRHGNAVRGADGRDAGEARLYARDGQLLAVARFEERLQAWQPRKVLV